MYRYEASSRAGFIELLNDSVGPEQLRSLLLQVPRVCEVVPHRAGSKAAQGNPSDGHAQQHNWQVVSFALQLDFIKSKIYFNIYTLNSTTIVLNLIPSIYFIFN